MELGGLDFVRRNIDVCLDLPRAETRMSRGATGLINLKGASPRRGGGTSKYTLSGGRMTSDRWRRIETLYHEMLMRPANERAEALVAACPSDARLRAEVQSLLDQPTSTARLGTPAAEIAAHLMSPALSGRRLGAFELQERLGVGGMGEVYRARDTRLGREVAIKILPGAFKDDPDRLARFEREARVLASLNHPHIGAIYGLEDASLSPGSGQTAGLALVLELVEGDTLAERIARGPLSLAEALPIAGQIAHALNVAHKRGIVHRDLKPANIKITPEGVVKVLDFGLAKTDRSGDDVTSTTSDTLEGMILGTAPYMSPEQVRGKPVDSRADIWAFGCVLYEMLTGRLAFRGETVSDTIAAILEREPDWKALPTAVPPGVRRLLRRCLEKDAQRRLPDLAETRLETEEALDAAVTGQSSKSDRAFYSLAVLPFANDSGDLQMEYFSDGLTESLIRSLSRLTQLRVMARSTVFRYKGRGEDAQEIGRVLGVGTVATGRVLQRGDTLIVNIELVDVENGWQLWGTRYTRTVGDIFAMEEDIATEISGKLLSLTPEIKKLLATRYTENVEAYHRYLKGKFFWAKRTEEGLNKGIQYFRQAIEIDPTYALAYAGLAEGYMPMGYYGHVPPAEALLKAREAAKKALEIDPTLSEARTVLAGAKWLCEWDMSGAERELRSVVEQDPNYPRARQVLAEMLLGAGRFAEAAAEATRALELDPLSLSNNMQVAVAHYYAREYDETVEQCRRTIEMDSSFYPAHWILGMAYEQKEQFSEAAAELRQARALSNNSTDMLATLGGIYARWGNEEAARHIMRELEELAGRKYVSQVLIAVILAGLGEMDRAVMCLEQAFEERDPKLSFLKVDPRLDRLRREPRLHNLMLKMRLAEVIPNA